MIKFPFLSSFRARETESSDFENYYNKEWLGRHSYFSDHQKRFIESWRFIENLNWQNSEVIDIGGVGPLSAFAEKKFGAHLHTTSHDLRMGSLMPDSFADIVLCTETIEHIKDINSDSIVDLEAFNWSGVNNMLADIARTSKYGAKVFITTPNSSSYISLSKWLKKQPLMMDPRHVREFTVSELEEKCSNAGLKKLAISTINTWSTFNDRQMSAYVKLLEDTNHNVEDRGDNILAIFTVQK